MPLACWPAGEEGGGPTPRAKAGHPSVRPPAATAVSCSTSRRSRSTPPRGRSPSRTPWNHRHETPQLESASTSACWSGEVLRNATFRVAVHLSAGIALLQTHLYRDPSSFTEVVDLRPALPVSPINIEGKGAVCVRHCQTWPKAVRFKVAALELVPIELPTGLPAMERVRCRDAETSRRRARWRSAENHGCCCGGGSCRKDSLYHCLPSPSAASPYLRTSRLDAPRQVWWSTEPNNSQTHQPCYLCCRRHSSRRGR